MTNEYWQALITNDPEYDDVFLYGVVTTKIFCRPSCKSKVPKKTNVRFFHDIEEAYSGNFRPCKRCRPDHSSLPEEDWIEQVISWIDHNYNEVISLQRLSEVFYTSPYHFQRKFKQLKGISPLEYVQDIRFNKALELLINSDKNITDISLQVGFSSYASFTQVFKQRKGMTPSEFRKHQALVPR
ncbi:bifunctional transcriptional activator/DNA repair enzyme AdaA [Pseudalkalibacillus salsuginis]|uniref:bifunctional transcriptional activator/DNA repair enzyme AdaA n=1 Tax=Pseudalkalibacillus salsuginis TaxID=2910972 RepID=UPI001F408FA8|nr:Ada metal-binding domain-containing protein [Pseudalkalibacillus salsuginis]MCF6411060.1 helix-turn-helix domain-containing protein [Pseudalkalibacillus salsuginis]